jgi:hypothetical protein
MPFRVPMDGGQVIEVDTPAEAVALLRTRGPLTATRYAPAAATPKHSPSPRPAYSEQRVGTGSIAFRLITRRNGTRISIPECRICGQSIQQGGCACSRQAGYALTQQASA